MFESRAPTHFYFLTRKYFTILFQFLELLRSLDRFKVLIRVIISEFSMTLRKNFTKISARRGRLSPHVQKISTSCISKLVYASKIYILFLEQRSKRNGPSFLNHKVIINEIRKRILKSQNISMVSSKIFSRSCHRRDWRFPDYKVHFRTVQNNNLPLQNRKRQNSFFL